jgi:Mn-dependent DtxR family transcriptional regulator
VAAVIHFACPRCRGSGQIPLTGVYAETLALLKRQRREASGADLARLDGCSGPAMCNRLARMEHLGLVVSRRYGHLRLYRATTNGDRP